MMRVAQSSNPFANDWSQPNSSWGIAHFGDQASPWQAQTASNWSSQGKEFPGTWNPDGPSSLTFQSMNSSFGVLSPQGSLSPSASRPTLAAFGTSPSTNPFRNTGSGFQGGSSPNASQPMSPAFQGNASSWGNQDGSFSQQWSQWDGCGATGCGSSNLFNQGQLNQWQTPGRAIPGASATAGSFTTSSPSPLPQHVASTSTLGSSTMSNQPFQPSMWPASPGGQSAQLQWQGQGSYSQGVSHGHARQVNSPQTNSWYGSATEGLAQRSGAWESGAGSAWPNSQVAPGRDTQPHEPLRSAGKSLWPSSPGNKKSSDLPVAIDIARGFIEALQAEHIHGIRNAVAKYLQSRVSHFEHDPLLHHQEKIRRADDPERAIAKLIKRWNMQDMMVATRPGRQGRRSLSVDRDYETSKLEGRGMRKHRRSKSVDSRGLWRESQVSDVDHVEKYVPKLKRSSARDSERQSSYDRYAARDFEDGDTSTRSRRSWQDEGKGSGSSSAAGFAGDVLFGVGSGVNAVGMGMSMFMF
mmetsp:Transcript_57362/g.101761  ORF Transcript_57362/g.101761 Transcript_57362/m.101761 type:complete len:524 (-) Transcript_57362:2-1573(-)